jgi:hypothetical protein
MERCPTLPHLANQKAHKKVVKIADYFPGKATGKSVHPIGSPPPGKGVL